MENKCDYKSLSLQLYGREVEIILKENSASYNLYHSLKVRGKLVGRFWDDRLLPDGTKEETVLALTIQNNAQEFEIKCDEIESLKGI